MISGSERLYDRNFAIALIGQTSFVLGNTLTTHYNRWISHLGGDIATVGWIMGAGSVVGLLLRPWMGQWINRLGARNTWLLGYLLFAIAAGGNLFLYDLGWFIYVLRSGLVLGAALVFASSLTYITQTTPPDRRTEAIGVLGVGGFMGMLAGPFLGDLILGAGERTRDQFEFLFVATMVTLVLPTILLFFLRVPRSASGNGAVGLGDFIRITRENWPGTILLVDLAFGVCMTAPFVFLGTYIDEIGLHIPGVSMMGLFFWCYAGWGLTVRLGLRRLPDRIGRRKVLLAGLLFMVAGMYSYAMVSADRPWLLIVPALLCGTGHALMFHTMASLTLETFDHDVRGTGSALSLMMLDLGMIAGAPILGWIAAQFGFHWSFICIGTLCLATAIIYTATSVPVWRERNRRGKPPKEPLAEVTHV